MVQPSSSTPTRVNQPHTYFAKVHTALSEENRTNNTMAVIHSPKGVFFSHPIIGMNDASTRLGEMSMDLILTLHTLQYYEQNKADLETGFIDPSNGQVLSKMNFTDQPQIRDLRERAYVSAVKGYNPPLLVLLGARYNPQFTPDGQIKADLATQLIHELNADAGKDNPANSNIGYEPGKWKEADWLFNNASIPMRTLAMLSILAEAIDDAERRNAEFQMAVITKREVEITDASALSHHLGLNDPLYAPAYRADKDGAPRNRDNVIDLNNPTKTYLDDPGQNMVRLSHLTDRVKLPDQIFRPAMYPVGKQKFEAWVPTSTFGQKARTDVKYLIKFGLVEMRAFISPGPGRPKHIIKPSVPGTYVLVDLARRGIDVRAM